MSEAGKLVDLTNLSWGHWGHKAFCGADRVPALNGRRPPIASLPTDFSGDASFAFLGECSGTLARSALENGYSEI